MRDCSIFVFPTTDETTLTEYMRLAQAGDHEAYRFVLDRCRDTFVRLARERCPAAISEDEIVRRCLLTLHCARHTFDSGRSFFAWVDAIARHHGIGEPESVGVRGAWWTRIGALLRELRRRTARAAFETNRGKVLGHRQGASET